MSLLQTAKSPAGVRWQITGTMIQACNCDWGCPCEFNARPTQGHCHGAWTWHVDEGSFGSTSLAGIHFGAACKWPGALHEGNGECLPLLDARATPAQLEALGVLLSGRAGGPWEIIKTTLSTIHEPRIVDWEVDGKGAVSRVRAGDVFQLDLAPMTNPVTGAPFEAIVRLPEGFVAKELAHAASHTFRVGGPIDYAYPGRDAAFGEFTYEGVLPQ